MNRPRNQYTDWNKVPLMLDTVQAGLLLQITPDSVSRLCRSGVLPAMQLGAQWRVSREAIRERLVAKPTDPRYMLVRTRSTDKKLPYKELRKNEA